MNHPPNPKMQLPPDFEPRPDITAEDLEKHSRTPFILTIVGLFVISVIAIASIYFFIVKDAKETLKELEPAACTADAMLCPDGSYVGRSGPNCEFICPDDPTANWQTYRNEEFGFEIKYPNTWTVEEKAKMEHNSKWIEIQPIEFKLQEVPGTESMPNISIRNFDIKFNELSKNYWSGNFQDDCRKITIIDRQGYFCKPSITFSGHTETYIEKDDRTYVRIYDSVLNKESEQILSTFKFTESGINTSNWQTYRNEEFGFEIKYPEDWQFTESVQPSFGITFSGRDERVSVFPNGEYDFGLPATEPMVSYPIISGNETTRTEWDIVDSQKFIEVNFSTYPKSWNDSNRIDIVVFKDNIDTIDQILSTFKFTK